MKLGAELGAFEDRLGHRFASPDLLMQALTHPSMSGDTRPSNQRLEFLGDRVLNLILAEALFRDDPQASEGQLAPRYNVLVRKETLAEVARQIGLGEAVRLGRSEMMSGGRRKDAMLADAMEAVLAAVYLDAGIDVARAVVLTHWAGRIGAAEAQARDAKTALQEWAQARGERPPHYALVERAGPDHAPVFTVEAQLATGEAARATASPKRQAEQAAAQALLDRLEGRA